RAHAPRGHVLVSPLRGAGAAGCRRPPPTGCGPRRGASPTRHPHAERGDEAIGGADESLSACKVVADPMPVRINALMEKAATPSRPSGRLALGLGVGCALLGLLLYGVQLSAGRTDAPWYAPALATLGVVLVLSSLQRRRGVWRVLALVLVMFLAAFEW